MRHFPTLSMRNAMLMFPIIMVLALAVFGVAFNGLSQYQKAFSQHVAEVDMPALHGMALANIEFQSIERDLYSYLLSAPHLDRQEIASRGQALIARLEHNIAAFNTQYTRQPHHDTDQIEHLHEQTTQAGAALRAALVEVTQAASADPAQISELTPELTQAASAFSTCLNDQIQAIRTRIASNVQERAKALDQEIQKTAYKMLLFTLFVSLFVLTLFTLVRLNLKKIYHYLQALADKQFGFHTIPIIHDHEFRPLRDVAQNLSETHIRLREANQALAQERDLLDQRIKERTRELEKINRNLAQEVVQRRVAETNARLYQIVVEQASEAVIITDTDNRIIEVNDAYLKTTGYTRDEVIGKTPKLVQSGRHDQAFYQDLWQSIEDQGRWSGEIWDRRKDGEVYPTWLSVNAIKDDNGMVVNHVGIFIDITEQKKAQDHLEQLAFRDPLTGTANRTLFQDRLIHEMDLGERQNWQVTLFYIDLDLFKEVNDTFGHNVGDDLLILVAERIQKTMRKSDTIARLGGDEFAVILPGDSSKTQIASLADRVVDFLQQPYTIDGQDIHIGASIGVALFPADADNFEALTDAADKAMYHAKRTGRGTYKFYSDISS